MPKALKILAAVVILATVIIAFVALSGQEKKYFQMDREQIEAVLTQSRKGKNPFKEARYSNVRTGNKVRLLKKPTAEDGGARLPIWFGEFRVEVPGKGFAQKGDDCVTGKTLTVLCKASPLNGLFASASKTNPFATGSLGANAVEAYVRSTKPYERLRDIFRATVKAVDAPGEDWPAKYRALYLYSLKVQLLPPMANDHFEEFIAPAGRGFLAGDVTKGKKLVDIAFYHVLSKRFFTIQIQGKDGAAMDEVYSLLAGLAVTYEG